MCKKAPGARCSGHTLKQLETKKIARDKVSAKLNESVLSANAAAKAGREASFRKFNTAANTYQARLDTLDMEIRHLQRDYDGTPKGQAELQAILANPETTTKEYNETVARINKGAALRSLRNNLLEINDNARTPQIRQALFGLDDGEFGEERVATI